MFRRELNKIHLDEMNIKNALSSLNFTNLLKRIMLTKLFSKLKNYVKIANLLQ